MGEVRADTIFFGKGSITQNRDMFQKHAVREQLSRVGFKGTLTGKDTPLEKLARDTAATKIRLERQGGEFRLSKEKLQQTEKFVAIDRETGLLNKRAFEQRLHEEVEEARRTNTPLTVLYIDLDKFKEVNDMHGHQVGDRLIKAAARIYRRGVRPYDVVGRVGGDEFAIILKGTVPRARVEATVQRINQGFVNYKAKHQQYEQIQASIGVATFQGEANINAEKLIKRADDAMTNAKLIEGTSVYFWSSMTKRIYKSNISR